VDLCLVLFQASGTVNVNTDDVSLEELMNRSKMLWHCGDVCVSVSLCGCSMSGHCLVTVSCN